MEIDKLIDECENLEIVESIIISRNKFKNSKYKKIMCSISGGSDSDIILDLCEKLKSESEAKIEYVFFDTGLEYQATKEHLKYLEEKYNIEIIKAKAVKPIPLSCRQYGQPFLSKQVSEFIQRLQRHNFKWENKTFEELLAEYPKCKAALKWWCNEYPQAQNGRESKFNIAYNKGLKEFMLLNPPEFKISNKCCYFAKKLLAENYKKQNNIDLSIVGVRRAEGGARSSAYKDCFSVGKNTDEYRMIFWYLNETKNDYEKQYDILHSRCYTEYGLKRTGCAGCPFGKDFEKELKIIENYEPKLFKAVNKIFGDSYKYTRAYLNFKEKIK